MGWTTPKTWGSGDVLSSVDLNAHVRDNLAALKSPPSDDHYLDPTSGSGYIQITSTSFTDIDATNWSYTITTTGGDVMVGFHSLVSVSAEATMGNFNVAVDGTPYFPDAGIAGFKSENTAGEYTTYVTVSFTALLTVAAGSHTFSMQAAAIGGGGVRIWDSTSTTNAFQVHPQFWVREVS